MIRPAGRRATGGAGAPRDVAVVVTFDFEGTWGMPHRDVPYDLCATTASLLEVLRRNGVRAVFFSTARMFDEYPDVVRALHAAGHEIGVHGVTHEHLHDLTEHELSRFAAELEWAGHRLEQLTGRRPVGFRAPYLMGPVFYDPRVYEVLRDQGYTWVSNREVRTPEELFRPDRLRVGLELTRSSWVRAVLLAVLNVELLRKDPLARELGPVATLRWLTRPEPFRRPEGLVEHPLVSPLDCDLLGYPLPTLDSGPALTTFAERVLLAAYRRSDRYFNLSSHDWISGCADRVQVLGEVLRVIAADPASRFVLPGIPGSWEAPETRGTSAGSAASGTPSISGDGTAAMVR